MKNIKSFYHSISGAVTNSSLCPNLDLKTRVIGFLITFLVGGFMIISSLGQLFSLALGGQTWFALWYTTGNVVCLSSTFFLMGPKKQCELMLKPGRFRVSVILILSMLVTVILALVSISKILTIISITVQFCFNLVCVILRSDGTKRVWKLFEDYFAEDFGER